MMTHPQYVVEYSLHFFVMLKWMRMNMLVVCVAQSDYFFIMGLANNFPLRFI